MSTLNLASPDSGAAKRLCQSLVVRIVTEKLCNSPGVTPPEGRRFNGDTHETIPVFIGSIRTKYQAVEPLSPVLRICFSTLLFPEPQRIEKMTEETSFPCKLDSMLGERGTDTMYPCIRDLLEHGLDLSRFSVGDITPNLQDITHYLAAWSRHAGLSEEESSAWLIDYCVATGFALSRRTPAAIRHSTKSTLRYIYRSAVSFLCQGASNSFRAPCGDCTVHGDMPPIATSEQLRLRLAASKSLPPPAPLPKKEAFREQFQAGLHLMREEVQKGTHIQRILEMLNERGFKTRTGRQWQSANLRVELQSLMNSHLD